MDDRAFLSFFETSYSNKQIFRFYTTENPQLITEQPRYEELQLGVVFARIKSLVSIFSKTMMEQP